MADFGDATSAKRVDKVIMSAASPRSARVVIAEDDEMLRYTLRLIVEEHYEIAGEAIDGETAVAMTEELLPDVVLLDISMPGVGGLEAARRIRESVPSVRIIMVSNYASQLYVDESLTRGAQGYVVKETAVLELPKAIEEVLNGRIYRPA